MLVYSFSLQSISLLQLFIWILSARSHHSILGAARTVQGIDSFVVVA
jgi:hypothetical protein